MYTRRCLVRSVRLGLTVRSLHARCTVSARSDEAHSRSMQTRKVAVVGAGFAGISAARTLLRDSDGLIDVTVLEASSRVGGRASTVQLPDCGRVEYGATWFHGIEGNPLYEHAVRLGLIDRKEAERERMLDAAQLLNTYFPNTVLQSSNAHAAAEPTWGAIKYVREGEPQLLNEEDAAMMTKARDQYSQAVESSLAAAQTGSPAVVGQGVRQAFHQAMQQLSGASDRARALFTDGWAWREQLQRAMDGCHTTDDMSALSLAQYEEFDGPNIPLPSGYQILAEKLAEGLPVRHGVTVSRIDWGQEGVQLHCSDGEVIEADAVIVTVSLGVLKAQHVAMFHPPLPDATVAAIERLGFGIVDKIFVDFGSPVESASASIDGFCHQGPAGGSNGDQSKSVQQESLGQNKDIHSKRADFAQPLGQKEVISYSLLWNHDPQEFEPSESQQSAAAFHKQKQADAQINLSHCTDGQTEHQSASKGAGDKTPESHVIVAETDGIPNASLHPTTSTPSQGREELPSWAQGVYTLRFAGSEFVHSDKSDAAAASNRCGVMWITGDFARDMEATSDANLHKGIAAILQQFPALQLPKSFKVHRSVWGADPSFKGSYSYGSALATGQECQQLSEPVYKPQTRTPVLLFAGEACHPQYFGCTHGAYLTGQNQAKVLLNALSTTSSVRDS